jgi:uncharacterized protein YbaP (TraB family)
MILSSFLQPASRFSIITLLISAFFFTSCKGTRAAVNPADTLPNALLWKIDHKDLASPSYLFGTIHIMPEQEFFLPEGLEEAFNKSDKVIFEIDMDEMTDMGAVMGLMSGLMMEDGMTLKKLYTPEEYKEVSTYFEEMGMPMFLLENVKPMFLSMLAEMNMDPAAMESEDMKSYEMELYDMANASGKKVGGLETMQYQLSLFDSIAYKEQAQMLLDAVRGTTLESDMFDETVALYKQQNIEAMVAMVGESVAESGSNYEEVLLNNRNRNWIPLMIKKMKNGTAFFAVGAGHLGGPNGVIRLLRKEGYTLTPVSVYRENQPKRI